MKFVVNGGDRCITSDLILVGDELSTRQESTECRQIGSPRHEGENQGRPKPKPVKRSNLQAHAGRE